MIAFVVLLERSYGFSASHLYRRPDWSDERNRATFGRCANLPAHGHNYRLTLRVSGEIDSLTGFAVDLVALDRVVRERILDRLDHRHINEAVAGFGAGGKIPTTENLVLWMAAEISAALGSAGSQATLSELQLAEDDRLASIWISDPKR